MAGRLTRVLCEHFDECVGVDIAPSMIRHARRFNQFEDRCRYVLNGADDLAVLPDDHFDFVYTYIVLQHMRPKYMKRYIAEFMRVLVPRDTRASRCLRKQLEVAFEALPASGCRARIVLLEAPRVVRAGADVGVRARVENAGEVDWPSVGPATARRQISLGNHWLDEAGRTVVQDDGRAVLPDRGLCPGSTLSCR